MGLAERKLKRTETRSATEEEAKMGRKHHSVTRFSMRGLEEVVGVLAALTRACPIAVKVGVMKAGPAEPDHIQACADPLREKRLFRAETSQVAREGSFSEAKLLTALGAVAAGPVATELAVMARRDTGGAKEWKEKTASVIVRAAAAVLEEVPNCLDHRTLQVRVSAASEGGAHLGF